ncbi:hypothetical protein l13_20660 [Neisseria weaveri ATCC 51223]|nr:hypothetical protein l13_20660 [Neisseria weaveri ATCC 51223]
MVFYRSHVLFSFYQMAGIVIFQTASQTEDQVFGKFFS